MDPKFFSSAQQGIPMTAQQAAANARMMMALQQQQQQQQQPTDPSMQQYNAMAGAAAMGNMNFGGAPNLGSMAFGQGDMTAFDQSGFMFMNPMSAQQQQFMGQLPQSPAGVHMGQLASHQQIQQQQQQQQPSSQHPQSSIYAPQTNMASFPANTANGGVALQQQNRGLYQGGDSMISPNTPQSILFQQQQAAAMMNRVKQSPTQSPAMNSPHFQGSPVAANSPHVGGGRMPTDYAVSSPMVGSMSSPVQGQMPGMGPGMNRVIPSQAIGRYMQHMSATQQVMMQGNLQAMSSPMSNANRQISSQAPPPSQHNVSQAEQLKDSQSNSGTPNYPQQSPMQKNAASPAPHRSATPGSAASTPLQQHRQAEVAQQQQQPFKADSPNTAMEVSNPPKRPSSQTPHDVAPKTETPSPKPSPVVKNEQANSPNTGANEKEGSAQPQLTIYAPKTRNVDTYGGVDLKYFDKFDLKPLVPHFSELGVIDIHALIMSLKSGMKMEVTNALNTLTVVTSQHNLVLVYCEDLLDILLDYMEKDIFGSSSRFEPNGKRRSTTYMAASTERDLTYAELFDMSLDEMKSLIPTLEESTSDLWLSLRERCLCIFNIFRNLSFMSDNIEYLARHERFVTLLARIMDSTRHAGPTDGRDTSGRKAWFVGVRRMDTLDFRKSILLIFSNIAMQLRIRHTDMAGTFIRLTHDFLTNGPDTYYSLLAAETWAKIAVNYENRKTFSALVEKTSVACMQDIWIELASLIRRDFFTLDGKVTFNLTSSQLATLEFTIMGMYSIVGILNELPEERQLREQLFQSDRTVAMMILRLSVSLGESGVPNFTVATKRGMELVHNFVCGPLPTGNRQGEIENKTDENTEGTSQENVVKAAHRMLDMSAVRHLLMMAMLRPHTDAMMLRDLSDFITLIDGDNMDSFVA